MIAQRRKGIERKKALKAPHKHTQQATLMTLRELGLRGRGTAGRAGVGLSDSIPSTFQTCSRDSRLGCLPSGSPNPGEGLKVTAMRWPEILQARMKTWSGPLDHLPLRLRKSKSQEEDCTSASNSNAKVSKVPRTLVSQSRRGRRRDRPERLRVVFEEGTGCPDRPGPRSRVLDLHRP